AARAARGVVTPTDRGFHMIRRRALGGLALLVSLLVLVATFVVLRPAPRADLGALRPELDRQLNGPLGHPEPKEDLRAREDWFYGQRMFPGTHLPALALAAAVTQARVFPVVGRTGAGSHATSSTAAVGGSWTELGPRPI